eukprot:7544418-Lingulodinium_polyedra.AAC.1
MSAGAAGCAAAFRGPGVSAAGLAVSKINAYARRVVWRHSPRAIDRGEVAAIEHERLRRSLSDYRG